MTKYMKAHEHYILKAIGQKENLNDLHAYHTHQISWLQHERLIHLIVFLFCGLLFMSSFFLMLFNTTTFTFILTLLLGLLTSAYLIHYYKLENTVQRWYKISNSINYKLLCIGTNLYDEP